MSGDMPTFTFGVRGIEDNYASRRNYVVPYDETFHIVAESVGDALNELINRSDRDGNSMWEGLDQESGFTIEFVDVVAP